MYNFNIFREQGWHVFTGNELGGLLGWWCWHSYRELNPKEDASDLYMMASTVSSKILKTMAAAEGFQFFVRFIPYTLQKRTCI